MAVVKTALQKPIGDITHALSILYAVNGLKKPLGGEVKRLHGCTSKSSCPRFKKKDDLLKLCQALDAFKLTPHHHFIRISVPLLHFKLYTAHEQSVTSLGDKGCILTRSEHARIMNERLQSNRRDSVNS